LERKGEKGWEMCKGRQEQGNRQVFKSKLRRKESGLPLGSTKEKIKKENRRPSHFGADGGGGKIKKSI